MLRDPFKDFGSHFDDDVEKSQRRITRFAVVGTLLSLIMTGGVIAGIAYAVIWIHRHW